jgi:uncharacterized membrane protein YqaE (UPF0057 family)
MSAAVVLLPGFIAVAAMFGLFGKIIIKILDVFTAIFPIIPLLFDPPRLFNEIITGVTIGLSLLIESVFGFLNPAKYGDTPEARKNRALDKVNQKCYKTSLLNIIFLIICPPFALFQAHGFIIHEIAICTLLTVYGYYFPGLIYAIMSTNIVWKKKKEDECKNKND